MENVDKLTYFEYSYYCKNIKRTRRIFISWIILYYIMNTIVFEEFGVEQNSVLQYLH